MYSFYFKVPFPKIFLSLLSAIFNVDIIESSIAQRLFFGSTVIHLKPRVVYAAVQSLTYIFNIEYSKMVAHLKKCKIG